MNPDMCPVCHHAPILHEPDGTGSTCVACVYMALQKEDKAERDRYPVCVIQYTFKLGQREREQASLGPRDAFQMHAPCINCGGEWCQHKGFLCPSGDSTFLPLIEGHMEYLRRSDVEN